MDQTVLPVLNTTDQWVEGNSASVSRPERTDPASFLVQAAITEQPVENKKRKLCNPPRQKRLTQFNP